MGSHWEEPLHTIRFSALTSPQPGPLPDWDARMSRLQAQEAWPWPSMAPQNPKELHGLSQVPMNLTSLALSLFLLTPQSLTIPSWPVPASASRRFFFSALGMILPATPGGCPFFSHVPYLPLPLSQDWALQSNPGPKCQLRCPWGSDPSHLREVVDSMVSK